jgi:molybdopterin-binding protein
MPLQADGAGAVLRDGGSAPRLRCLAAEHLDSRLLQMRRSPIVRATRQLPGTAQSVTLGFVTARVAFTVGRLEFVTTISRAEAERLQLKAGDQLTVVVSSDAVKIERPGVVAA